MSFSLKRFFRKSYIFRSLYWLFVLNWFDLGVINSRLPRTVSNKKRVVFVRMDGIGDYVLWTTAFPSVAAMYPSHEYERILIGNQRFAELANQEPTFDKKIFVELEKFVLSPMYRFRLLKRVRQLGPDVIFNARSTRDFLWGDSIVKCSGAKTRIGSEGIGNMMGRLQDRMTRRWYTELRGAPPAGQHELISNLKMLGVSDDDLALGQALESVRQSKQLVSDNYAVFFVGSQSSEKCWPSDRFGELANRISNEFEVLLCGGPDEQYLAAGFKKEFKGDSVDLIGPTALSLTDLTAHIQAASLVVTNDTVAAHIAALSERPTIVIAPGNQPGRYFPYPERVLDLKTGIVRVLSRPEMCRKCDEACSLTKSSDITTRPCIESITVDEAVAAATSLLSKK